MKGKRVVCRSCKWDSKVRVNTRICPKCKRPVSAYRQPDGRHAQMPDDRIKPTPELAKKRKAGMRDETIDALLVAGRIVNVQAQAYQTFRQAHRTLYGPSSPKVNALQPMIPGEAGELPDDAIERAHKMHRAGLDAMGLRGSAAVHHLMFHNEVLHLDCLRDGLDALCEAYGLDK